MNAKAVIVFIVESIKENKMKHSKTRTINGKDYVVKAHSKRGWLIELRRLYDTSGIKRYTREELKVRPV